MPSTEAQRTLVKSPPELWTELSDPSSLARHLGELGEIRITRVEAETTVEWEGESVSGMVTLEPSGWGTKVTLTVDREIPEPTVAIARPDPEPAPEPRPEPEPTVAIARPRPEPAPEPQPEEPDAAEPEAAPAPPAPRWRQRLLARISRWRRTRQPGPDPAEPETAEPDPAEPEAQAVESSEPSPDLAAELAGELAAELARLEATMVEQDAALLATVLDRLGAAHHRPFSRS
jgi:outer membrane biosynthesis protein TonB